MAALTAASRCLNAPDEAAGRRALRAQIARLELRLAKQTMDLATPSGDTAPPATPAGARVHSRHPTPRLQSLGELECTRDSLVAAIAAAQATLVRREAQRATARRKLAALLAEPARHPFARVRLAELGESGCGAYTVVPRIGLLGMLASWWEVKLSSGCP